jgi:hypothetical protein
LIGLLFAPPRIGGCIGGYRLEKAFSSRNHNYSAAHKNEAVHIRSVQQDCADDVG